MYFLFASNIPDVLYIRDGFFFVTLNIIHLYLQPFRGSCQNVRDVFCAETLFNYVNWIMDVKRI